MLFFFSLLTIYMYSIHSSFASPFYFKFFFFCTSLFKWFGQYLLFHSVTVRVHSKHYYLFFSYFSHLILLRMSPIFTNEVAQLSLVLNQSIIAHSLEIVHKCTQMYSNVLKCTQMYPAELHNLSYPNCYHYQALIKVN